MKHVKLILPILIALIGGFLLRGCFSPASPEHQSSNIKSQTYTCSMHPQIKLTKPGKCPICFMDLIPLESGDAKAGAREISVSPYAAKLMELETTEVTRQFKSAEVRMVGKVNYDETRVTTISAWVPGRIDRLFVDYTGISVKKGDHLAELYSPELRTAQTELLQSIKHNPSLIEATREKLRLWGLTADQIARIETSGTPTDHMTIYSPASGIVIHKNATEGMYVQTGTQIYTIADLSTVWIQLDAYESDLNWLRYGERVDFTTEAYPGTTFTGTISFIDPIINAATRTAKVRVIVENPTLSLKPGMFVRAIARPQAGENPQNAPLVIPVTAALKTGKRAVVYVEIPDQDKPTYEGREVELGARIGDFYIVAEGLKEGERVVTRGAFKLDAELQIHAKPSMMSMPDETHQMEQADPKPQTLCPIMGGAINKEFFTDYNGMRIYFCCGGCDQTFKADPEKYLEQMRAAGIEPESLR
jgi:Cu(I)/Ag(I) efflux system membrane fusion protein